MGAFNCKDRAQEVGGVEEHYQSAVKSFQEKEKNDEISIEVPDTLSQIQGVIRGYLVRRAKSIHEECKKTEVHISGGI